MKSILIFVFSFLIFNVFSQKGIVKLENGEVINTVICNNYPNLNAVEKFNKFELAIGISKEFQNRITAFIKKKTLASADKNYPVNPYLSWDFRLTAQFKHTKTGQVKNVDAFYTQLYDRDERSNSWKQKNNAYPLRVRFAPTEIGEWTCTFKTSLKGKTIKDKVAFNFNVVESSNKGFVSVYDKDTRFFQQDGKVFVPLGINLPYPIVGSNINYTHNKKEKLHMSCWKDYLTDVKNYAELEGDNKVMRFFLSNTTSDIEQEEVGNYTYRLNFAQEIDNMVEICEQNDTYIDFNLMLHTPTMKFGDFYAFNFDWGKSHYADDMPNYCYKDLLNSDTPSDMFTTELGMKYLKEKHRYIIARWGYSTAIFMFEVLSEPWHINTSGELTRDNKCINIYEPYYHDEGDLERKAVMNYHKDISNYIKEELGHTEQLIGAVSQFPYKPYDVIMIPEIGKEKDSCWVLPNIDVVCISHYNSSPEKMIKGEGARGNEGFIDEENSFANKVRVLNNYYNKPIYMSEGGPDSAGDDCGQLQGLTIETMRMGFTNMAGSNIWGAFYYGPNQLDKRKTWKPVAVSNKFINQPMAIRIRMDSTHTQGRQSVRIKSEKEKIDGEELKEMQYIASGDNAEAVGYVYNRSFNYHTIARQAGGKYAEDPVCKLNDKRWQEKETLTAKNGRVFIEKFGRRKKYLVEFYGYEDGKFLEWKCLRSNIFGKLKIEHPTLTPEIDGQPIVWFTVQKTNCNL